MSQNYKQLVKYSSILDVKPNKNDIKHAKNNVRWPVINNVNGITPDYMKYDERKRKLQRL